MSIAQLYNPPIDQPSLELWSFANADSHEQIIIAVGREHKVTLTRYLLYPVSTEALTWFLVQHQQAHNDINATIGGGGNDYTDISFNDIEALQQVIFLHAQDHQRIHNALGIQ